MAGSEFSSFQMATSTSQHASAQPPSLNESAGNDSSTVPDDQMPERASFMGIPPEMRLRIYDFLLDGGRLDDIPLTHGESHCCATDISFGPQEEQLKCMCAKCTFPQILAVNKLVFAEAAPLLYSTTELRIALPTYGHAFDIDARFKVLCDNAKASITNAVLPTRLRDIDIVLYAAEQPSNNMSSLWTRLAAEFPRLKNIRLQIRFDDELDFGLEVIDWQQFAGVLSLPGIESLDVEIMHYDDEEISKEMAEPFATGLDASLRAEMTRLGKSIKILSFGKEEKVSVRDF